MQKMTNPFRITLPDGRKINGKTSPLDIVMTERHLGGVNDRNKGEAVFYSMMLALKREHGIEFDSFDDFLDNVDDAEIGDDTGNGAGPSSEPPSPGSPTGATSPRKRSSRT